MKVKKRLEMYLKGGKKEIHVLSYTDRVSDYMDVSELLITKPGGMTISEALVKGLPTLVVSPIPGNEEGNAHYLLRHGAALMADTAENIGKDLHKLLGNKAKLQQMKTSSKLIARPNACQDILQLLEKLVTH